MSIIRSSTSMKKTYSLLSLAPPNDESVVGIAGGGENI